jgi:hypothetical protein
MAIPADQFWPILYQTCLTIVIVFGLAGLAAGVGLITSSAATFRFFGVMNRWVSLRPAFRGMEVPRDSADRFAHRNRYAVGIALIIGGAASLVILLTQISGFALAPSLAKGKIATLLEVVAESLRWFLVVGGAFGVITGLLLCFAPGALGRIESYANRWVSPRQMSRGVDDQKPVLDELIASHPRRSGWIFVCGGIAAVAYAAALLMRQ